MGNTLIFPCCVPDAELYAEEARQRGERIVAASSLAFDPTASKFETWFSLPYVHDVEFFQNVQDAIKKHDIERIYCPVTAAYIVLSRLVAEAKLPVRIISEMPLLRLARRHRNLMTSAVESHDFIQQIAGGRSPLTQLEVASILHASLSIFGESDKAKLAALMAVFADAPNGDVIEIGVLAGRSAATLALAAQRHKTGTVLVVDPWSVTGRVQASAHPDLQAPVDGWHPAIAFESFVVALLPIAQEGHFNYLAMPSTQAHATWYQQRKVITPEFGEACYSSLISVLHIDGNHDYRWVSEDCATWLPHLAPGGWLILDDYLWLHGDGPKRVGNELLAQRAKSIQRAFCCGNALFVRFGE